LSRLAVSTRLTSTSDLIEELKDVFMEFYILPILLPALPIDIALTAYCLRRNRKILSVLGTAFVYVITTAICIAIFKQDIRFQGQGVIGIIVFFAVGVVLTLVRLVLGVLMLLARKDR
jgi:hypothetical protein